MLRLYQHLHLKVYDMLEEKLQLWLMKKKKPAIMKLNSMVQIFHPDLFLQFSAGEFNAVGDDAYQITASFSELYACQAVYSQHGFFVFKLQTS
jgi:hypothetical protein